MLRKVLFLAVFVLSLTGAIMGYQNAFDGPDPPPPCSPKTCPQPPVR